MIRAYALKIINAHSEKQWNVGTKLVNYSRGRKSGLEKIFLIDKSFSVGILDFHALQHQSNSCAFAEMLGMRVFFWRRRVGCPMATETGRSLPRWAASSVRSSPRVQWGLHVVVVIEGFPVPISKFETRIHRNVWLEKQNDRGFLLPSRKASVESRPGVQLPLSRLFSPPESRGRGLSARSIDGNENKVNDWTCAILNLIGVLFTCLLF